MSSKIEKLQAAVSAARKQRSHDIARLQAELSAEVAKAKKGSGREKPAKPADDS